MIAYIPDHCPTALGPGPEGWGEYHLAAVGLAAGADLLIHDSYLLPDEVAAEASFGHAAADYAVGLARRARARRVMFFHHKPDRTDDALDLLAGRFSANPRVTVAAEGQVIDPGSRLPVDVRLADVTPVRLLQLVRARRLHVVMDRP